MEILSIVLLLLILFSIIVLFMLYFFSKGKNQELNDTLAKNIDFLVQTKLTQLEKTMHTDIHNTQMQFGKDLREDFERLNASLERKVLYMQNQMDLKLDKGFEQTTQTFQNVLERLTKIDQAQKKIDALSTNIVTLQDILNDKKARGAFGEIQLVNIFKTVFGLNDKLYQTQYTLSNHTKVDLMLFAPEPMGNVAIDSKFPLENYRRMLETHTNDTTLYERQFKADIKKHIDDISSKYIIFNETAEYAIMFIPAEAVFAHINAYHQDVVEYGYQKKVWLTSPTTLMAMLTTIQVVLKNIERDKYAKVIRDELQNLSREFGRYQLRWQALAKHIDQVSRDVKDVNVTSNKIISRFSKIEAVDFTDTSENKILIDEVEEEEA